MMQVDIEKLKDRVEPGCCEAALSVEANMVASIAISLKRLADTLDGTTLGISISDTIFNPSR